jgi:hypothetical protein
VIRPTSRQVGLDTVRSCRRRLASSRRLACRPRWRANRSSHLGRRLERETGIEPATNSLEGCDSTTELLPPPRLTSLARSPLSAGRPALALTACLRASAGSPRSAHRPLCLTPARQSFVWLANRGPLRRATCSRGYRQAKVGGEGRTRTFEATRATDLQSAAFDRFATSPTCLCVGSVMLRALTYEYRWSWRRDLNPRPADYKSAALPG